LTLSAIIYIFTPLQEKSLSMEGKDGNISRDAFFRISGALSNGRTVF
jgi:hypothetical protein